MTGNQHSEATNRPAFPPIVEFARKASILLLRTESFLLGALILYLIGAGIVNGVQAPGALAGEILFSLIAAAGLYTCSRGFAQHRSYGRAPALLANLILVGVSYFMISGHLVWVGSALALFSGATAIANLLGYTE